MRKTWIRALVVATLILLPFVVHGLYRQMTALPREVVIATGPADGRYRVVSQSVAEELRRRHPEITVRLRHTDGSLDNLRLLRNKQVDFALYQPRTETILRGAQPDEHDEIAFVANIYTEVAHFIVRQGSGVEGPEDLRGRTVAVGQAASGDYAMSRLLLAHFGLDEEAADVRRHNYLGIEQGFGDGSLDAAFVTVGVRAPVLQRLFSERRCELLEIRHARALAAGQLSVSEYTIPAGLYRSHAPAVPEDDVRTVALRAQLLTRSDAPSSLVEEVAEIILSERFLKQNELTELFAGGREFARSKPEFAPHPATEGVFDPHLKPLLDSDFVEATEGMRSFVVSCLIAGYLVFRWLRARRVRSKEHRLDQYIRAMLRIERKQLELDQHEGASDLEALQTLLDELTELRQEALAELTAQQLNEDRAADSFLEMAHALSDKINAKITRQRTDKRFEELARAVRDGLRQDGEDES